YWDWLQTGRRPDDISWYIKAFTGNDDFVRGEITPAYATLDERYIRKIYSLNQDLRIFFILRNPLERAWSAAQMGLARLQITREEASDQWFSDVFRSRASLARGDYETTLRRWRRLFPAEQILILYYEHLKGNPRKLLAETAEHLGVDPVFFGALPEIEVGRNITPAAVPKYVNYPLTEPFAAELRRLYADKIASLSSYLHKDLSGWLDVPVAGPGDGVT
ncbi:MAG: sulfotransferase domain-containing protein, partial [Methylococcales bacterium]